MKTKRPPDASAPPVRRGAASPCRRSPGSRAGAHFSTFNETFEASPRDGRAPGPMGPRLGSRRARARPPRGSSPGGRRAATRRARPHPRRQRAQGEARPLPRGGLLSVLSALLGAFSPLLAPADPHRCSVRSFCRNRSHTSWHPVHRECPELTQTQRILGCSRKTAQVWHMSSQGLEQLCGTVTCAKFTRTHLH